MTPKRSNWYAEIAVALLVAALVVLCIVLVRQYRLTARQQMVSSERIHLADILRQHTLGAGDTGLIDSWMTFGYVSTSFKVPESYLMDQLDIASSTAGYPNITLSHYARSVGTSSQAVIGDVRDAVRSYLVPAGN